MPLTTSLNLSLAVIDLSVAADVGLTPFQTYQLAVYLPGFQQRHGSEQSGKKTTLLRHYFLILDGVGDHTQDLRRRVFFCFFAADI